MTVDLTIFLMCWSFGIASQLVYLLYSPSLKILQLLFCYLICQNQALKQMYAFDQSWMSLANHSRWFYSTGSHHLISSDLVLQKNISTSKVEMADSMKGSSESKNICELRFGSYCLWRQEHRERMKDHTVKKMKDLLYVARAYYPSIAKLSVLDKLSHELKQNIQDFERVLSETTADKDLPPQYGYFPC